MFSQSWVMKWLKGLLGLVIMCYLFFTVSNLDQSIGWSDLPAKEELNYLAIFFVFLLMPINWGIETLKWKKMIDTQWSVSFVKAYKCTLGGTSTAIFTPNRIGDVAGRMAMVPYHIRKHAFWSTVLCNLAQLAALLILGVPGIALLMHLIIDDQVYQMGVWILPMAVAIVVGVLSMFYYAKQLVPFFLRLIPIVSWRHYLQNTLEVMRKAKLEDLHWLLGWSILRTLIYAFQYYLTILFFDVKLGALETIASILSVYLLKTVVPYLPATGLIVRTEISLWVFSFFTTQLTVILAASFLIWTINVVIPAIWGYFLILTTDIKEI